MLHQLFEAPDILMGTLFIMINPLCGLKLLFWMELMICKSQGSL